MATISCSAQTTAANVVQKLMQLCGSPVSTSTGRVLRPKVGLVHGLAHSLPHTSWLASCCTEAQII